MTKGGQDNAVAASIEQSDAEFAFEQLDAFAQRGLRNTQRFCRPAKVGVLDQCQELA
ncbi:hypothetical protein D3C84_1017290 [compost metagenome]